MDEVNIDSKLTSPKWKSHTDAEAQVSNEDFKQRLEKKGLCTKFLISFGLPLWFQGETISTIVSRNAIHYREMRFMPNIYSQNVFQ